MLFLVDIDECDRDLDNCNVNATCMNTVGSYDCMCNAGFEGSGFIGDCNSEFQLVTLPMTGSSTSLLLCLIGRY